MYIKTEDSNFNIRQFRYQEMFENDMEDEPSNPSKSSDSESASMNSAAEVEVEQNMENE